MIAADVEELVVNYLAQSFPNVGLDLPADNIPLPFYLVNGVAGATSWITDSPIVSVHAFAATRTGAALAARELGKVMNPWVFTPKLGFALTDGRAHIDCFEIVERPTWRDYENPNLQRYCGRYRIELRVNQTS